MKLVFAGTPQFALPSLEAIAASEHELLAVVTRPDAPVGRGRKLAPSEVSAWAQERGIEVLTPSKPSDPDFLERLRQLAPDCVPVVAYGALVPQAALDIPAHGWVNLHFSLLPAWRGAAPVQYSIMHGDEVTGASVFALETGLDTGPVYGTVTETVRQDDTSGTVLERLAVSGAQLLVQVLDGVAEQKLSAVPQSSDGVTLAPKIKLDDARVRWGDPDFAVDRRIRAVTPAPGAWTMWDDNRVRLGPVVPAGNAPELGPGQLSVQKTAVYVGTGTGPVRLGNIQLPGKKMMDAAAWGRGLHNRDGIVFE
ncbi:MAG TPA: methionyl-tRNA formyltransferase [Candidatus Stackebrandtia faecavium]|nr:methionyl-tRNA formyltransferase [Candidatus Stackebrandtia faecavium]